MNRRRLQGSDIYETTPRPGTVTRRQGFTMVEIMVTAAI